MPPTAVSAIPAVMHPAVSDNQTGSASSAVQVHPGSSGMRTVPPTAAQKGLSDMLQNPGYMSYHIVQRNNLDHCSNHLHYLYTCYNQCYPGYLLHSDGYTAPVLNSDTADIHGHICQMTYRSAGSGNCHTPAVLLPVHKWIRNHL